MDTKDLLIGDRAEDATLIKPGSVEKDCDECGHAIPVDPMTQIQIALGNLVPRKIFCTRCVRKGVNKEINGTGGSAA